MKIEFEKNIVALVCPNGDCAYRAIFPGKEKFCPRDGCALIPAQPAPREDHRPTCEGHTFDWNSEGENFKCACGAVCELIGGLPWLRYGQGVCPGYAVAPEAPPEAISIDERRISPVAFAAVLTGAAVLLACFALPKAYRDLIRVMEAQDDPYG